ncbi:hypothetical protein [Paraburkholderia sp. MM6662-R1]|uniref:hypothetical protein n=1 Tax=Paraburkholderia sp. MM6662-R1 TaxID=2991066 RepID=UPI003D1A7F3E
MDGLGRFCFARRSIGDVYKIRGRYNQVTGGFYDEEGRMADLSALGYVTIQTLLVEAPDGFDLDSLDPLVDDDYDQKIVSVFAALREKELSFRPKPAKGGKAAGPRDGANVRAVVSPAVPSGPDGPSLSAGNG